MALELKATGSTFTIADSDLVPGGDPDTVYTVRYLTSEDVDRLRETHTKQKYSALAQSMVSELDTNAFGLAVLDHVIADWKGVLGDGDPLACTLEAKKLLPVARREKLLALARENVVVNAQRKEASFRTVA